MDSQGSRNENYSEDGFYEVTDSSSRRGDFLGGPAAAMAQPFGHPTMPFDNTNTLPTVNTLQSATVNPLLSAQHPGSYQAHLQHDAHPVRLPYSPYPRSFPDQSASPETNTGFHGNFHPSNNYYPHNETMNSRSRPSLASSETPLPPQMPTQPHAHGHDSGLNFGQSAMGQISCSDSKDAYTNNTPLDRPSALKDADENASSGSTETFITREFRNDYVQKNLSCEVVVSNIEKVTDSSASDYASALKTVREKWGLDLTRRSKVTELFGSTIARVNMMRTLALRYPGKGKAMVGALITESEKIDHRGKAFGGERALKSAKGTWFAKDFEAGNIDDSQTTPAANYPKDIGLSVKKTMRSKDDTVLEFAIQLKNLVDKKANGRAQSDKRTPEEVEIQMAQAYTQVERILDGLNIAHGGMRLTEQTTGSMNRPDVLDPELQLSAAQAWAVLDREHGEHEATYDTNHTNKRRAHAAVEETKTKLSKFQLQPTSMPGNINATAPGGSLNKTNNNTNNKRFQGDSDDEGEEDEEGSHPKRRRIFAEPPQRVPR